MGSLGKTTREEERERREVSAREKHEKEVLVLLLPPGSP